MEKRCTVTTQQAHSSSPNLELFGKSHNWRQIRKVTSSTFHKSNNISQNNVLRTKNIRTP